MCILKWTVKFFRTMNNYTCLVCMPCWCSCSTLFCFTIHVALGNTHNSYCYFLCDNIGTKYVQYVGFGNKIKEMNRCAENVSNATDTKHRFTIFCILLHNQRHNFVVLKTVTMRLSDSKTDLLYCWRCCVETHEHSVS